MVTPVCYKKFSPVGEYYIKRFWINFLIDVGKTCLLQRYMDNEFIPHHDYTIGVEFGVKCFNCYDKNIKLQVWDTVSYY